MDGLDRRGAARPASHCCCFLVLVFDLISRAQLYEGTIKRRGKEEEQELVLEIESLLRKEKGKRWKEARGGRALYDLDPIRASIEGVGAVRVRCLGYPSTKLEPNCTARCTAASLHYRTWTGTGHLRSRAGRASTSGCPGVPRRAASIAARPLLGAHKQWKQAP